MNKNILIIDDELIVCRSLKTLLDSRGHKTSHVQGAADARALVDQIKFDTILIDWQLNESTDGLELAQELAGRSPKSDIVLMTGHDAEQLADSIPEHCQLKTIQKPCSLDQLCEIAGLSADSAMPSAVPDSSIGKTR